MTQECTLPRGVPMKYWDEAGGAQVGRVVGRLEGDVSAKHHSGEGSWPREDRIRSNAERWQGWRAGSESSRLDGNWGDLPVEKGTHCVEESSAIFTRLETTEGSRTEQ